MRRTLLLTPALALSFALACDLFVGATAFGAGAQAEKAGSTSTVVPQELQEIGIRENLGGQVSVDSLQFKNEKGETVVLKDFLKSHKPVLLGLVYYECPNLCNLVLNGLVKGLQDLDWTPGNQFDIVAVSVNPNEKPELARSKREAYVKSYGKMETLEGWHFLTGEEPQIRQLAKEIGFGYKKEGDQYAHGAALYALTPEGKISRYLYGIEFKPTDLKMAMLEASNGKIGTVIDRILLFCYRYDPVTRKYSIYLSRLMTTAAAVTVFLFVAFVGLALRRERRLKLLSVPANTPSS